MTTAVQRRRGTNTEHSTFTGLDGEITVNTTTYTAHIHDGATVGGVPLAKADGSNIVTSSIDINGGTIDGTVIGGTTPAAVTTTALVATTADINGGTIDGTVIGGSTAAAGIFTTGQFDTSLNVDGTVTADGLTVDGTANVDNLIIDNAGKISSVGQIELQVDTDNNQSGTYIGFSRNNTTSERLALFQENGDISFYEDTGTTAKLFWDASAEVLTSNVGGYWRLQPSGAASTPAYSFEGDSDTGMYRPAGVSNTVAFSTAGTERMRIDASGNLLVGCTSAVSASVSGISTNIAGNDYAILDVGNTRTTSQSTMRFFNGNGEVGTIKTSASATSYNTSSDERLKENITDANDAGDKIDAIKVRQYDWKADGSHQDYGMVAQELMTVAPEAVSGDPESDDMMGVDYSKLVPMMLKEIQSLRARVAQLEGA